MPYCTTIGLCELSTSGRHHEGHEEHEGFRDQIVGMRFHSVSVRGPSTVRMSIQAILAQVLDGPRWHNRSRVWKDRRTPSFVLFVSFVVTSSGDLWLLAERLGSAGRESTLPSAASQPTVYGSAATPGSAFLGSTTCRRPDAFFLDHRPV